MRERGKPAFPRKKSSKSLVSKTEELLKGKKKILWYLNEVQAANLYVTLKEMVKGYLLKTAVIC